MSINITGMDQLQRELERRLGKQAMQRISDKALTKASQVFVRELKSQFQSFKDTGASIDEITLTDPYWKNGVRVITVHWKGPKERYRIIHLNEFGTVSNPNPKGKGAIARALQASESAYRQAIVDTFRGAF